MVRPVLQYFVILMCFFSIYSFGLRKGGKLGAVLLVGYLLVFGPWMARNLYTLGALAENDVKYLSIKFGIYPGLMYQDDPKTKGYPYRFDPNVSQVQPELGSILQEVKRRFATEPLRHLKWYGYEKGVMLWSWRMVVGAEEHMIFPVATSPYFYHPLFTTTSELMKLLHWPLVLLGLWGTVMVWFPRTFKEFSREQIFFIRTLSLLLIYYTAIHVLSYPLPRYTIPIRPILYAMAFLPMIHLKTLIQKRKRPTPDHETASSH